MPNYTTTNTFNITVNSNDGTVTANGLGTNYFYGNSQISFNGSYGARDYMPWMLFTGISIPADATVNQATLKIYGAMKLYNFFYRGMTFNAAAHDKATPVKSDINAAASTVAANYLIEWRNQSTQVPSNTQAAYVYNMNTNYLSKAAYQLVNLNVTNVVQSLYSSYGPYSNGNILFYLKQQSTFGGQAEAFVYAKNWDSGGGKSGELVIQYSAPLTPVDKTVYRYV